MKKQAIIIRGPAGAGKSTIASLLRKQLPNTWANLDIDKFKHVISMDSSEVRTEVAHNVAIYFIEQLSSNGFSIILEEIFREEFYSKVQKKLTHLGYKVLTIFLYAPKSELIKRDTERTEKTKGSRKISELYGEIKPLGEDFNFDTSKLSSSEIVDLIKDRII